MDGQTCKRFAHYPKRERDLPSTLQADFPIWPSTPSSVIQVTVRDDNDVPAINAFVKLSMSYLGIGRKKVPVATQLVSVGANQAVTLNFPTPSNFLTDQDGNPQQWLGAYVDLQHRHDQNLANDHATSMWLGVDTSQAGGPGSISGLIFGSLLMATPAHNLSVD